MQLVTLVYKLLWLPIFLQNLVFNPLLNARIHPYVSSLFSVCADVIFSKRLQMCQSFRVMIFRLVCKWVERWGSGGPRREKERERGEGGCLTGVICTYVTLGRGTLFIPRPFLPTVSAGRAPPHRRAFRQVRCTLCHRFLSRYDYALIEFIVKSMQLAIEYIRFPFFLFRFSTGMLESIREPNSFLSCNDLETTFVTSVMFFIYSVGPLTRLTIQKIVINVFSAIKFRISNLQLLVNILFECCDSFLKPICNVKNVCKLRLLRKNELKVIGTNSHVTRPDFKLQRFFYLAMKSRDKRVR